MSQATLTAFIPGDYVRLTKISEINPGVVDVGHWTEGFLASQVIAGRSIWVNRVRRAAFREEGVSEYVMERFGRFNTSMIKSWERIGSTTASDGTAYLLLTNNSCWKIEKVLTSEEKSS